MRCNLHNLVHPHNSMKQDFVLNVFYRTGTKDEEKVLATPFEAVIERTPKAPLGVLHQVQNMTELLHNIIGKLFQDLLNIWKIKKTRVN